MEVPKFKLFSQVSSAYITLPCLAPPPLPDPQPSQTVIHHCTGQSWPCRGPHVLFCYLYPFLGVHSSNYLSSNFCKGVSKHPSLLALNVYWLPKCLYHVPWHILSHLFTSQSVYPTAGKPVLDFYSFYIHRPTKQEPSLMPIDNDIKGKMGGSVCFTS